MLPLFSQKKKQRPNGRGRPQYFEGSSARWWFRIGWARGLLVVVLRFSSIPDRGVGFFFLGAIYLELAVSEFVSKEVWFVT